MGKKCNEKRQKKSLLSSVVQGNVPLVFVSGPRGEECGWPVTMLSSVLHTLLASGQCDRGCILF